MPCEVFLVGRICAYPPVDGAGFVPLKGNCMYSDVFLGVCHLAMPLGSLSTNRQSCVSVSLMISFEGVCWNFLDIRCGLVLVLSWAFPESSH